MMVRQNSQCAICLRDFDDVYPPFVDHNHMSGKVRKLLCRSCNSAIGYANENTQILQKMIAYIIEHNSDTAEVTVPTIQT